jgi:hypothetical protein
MHIDGEGIEQSADEDRSWGLKAAERGEALGAGTGVSNALAAAGARPSAQTLGSVRPLALSATSEPDSPT